MVAADARRGLAASTCCAASAVCAARRDAAAQRSRRRAAGIALHVWHRPCNSTVSSGPSARNDPGGVMSHTTIVRTVRGVLAALIACAAAVPVRAQLAAPAEDPTVPRSAKVADPAVYRAAQAYRGTKIMVSTVERRLRLVIGRDTVMNVPVGIGMGTDFEY